MAEAGRMRLSGRRVLLVGASSGIGRAAGLAIAAEGGRVAFAARRKARLEEALAEAGPEALAVTCDVRDESSCRSAVERAVAAFGGLDAVVYCPGISSFAPLREVDAQTWRAVLETNLVGATLVMSAAIGSLEASRGKALFLSSITIDDQPPRFAQAPYVVSKVALEVLVRAWQGEHRGVGFTTIAMGDTVTEFGLQEDITALVPIVKRWAREGYMYGRMMDASSVAAQIVNALASPETIRRIAITPHYPPPPPPPSLPASAPAPEQAPDGSPERGDAAEDWGAAALEEVRGGQPAESGGSSLDD